jgi:Tol biopolymer transport system component
LPFLAAAPAFAQDLEFIDLDSSETVIGGIHPVVSSTGRFVEFGAPNADGVYVRDRQLGLTERVDLSSGGAPANNSSFVGNDYGNAGAISSDGRFVLFESCASNLVSGDTNGGWDLFLRDRVQHTTVRVSLGDNGQQSAGNGGYPLAGTDVSDDWRYIVFSTKDSGLVGGDGNGAEDVFRFDRQTGKSTLVSVSTIGGTGNGYSLAPAMTSDGRYIAFISGASNLVAGDSNGAGDTIFVRDMTTGAMSVVNLTSSGAQGGIGTYENPGVSMSDDGRYVAFIGYPPYTAVDHPYSAVYVRDRQLGKTLLISDPDANNNIYHASLSGDGSRIAFDSTATNLTQGSYGGHDTYLCERATGITLRLSTDPNGYGSPAGEGCYPSLSRDGEFVVFWSNADTLLDNDPYPGYDAFLWKGCLTGIETYCTAKVNSQDCTPAILTSGTPQAGEASGFVISAENVINNKPGMFFYGLAGQQQAPFQNGYLCVRMPIVRLPLMSSGGNLPPDDCSGVYRLDFNTYMNSGADPRLVGGTSVDGQFWSRDPALGSPFPTGLTGGIHFVICN